MSLSTGMLLGYIAYDCIHYYIHHGSPRLTTLRNLKTAHMCHHYQEHGSAFGISSRLFDVLLGTSSLRLN